MARRRDGAKGDRALRVAFAASEYAPLLQTGGLGDAVAGLAGALAERGHELHCLLPGLGSLWDDPIGRRLEPDAAEVACLPDGSERGRWWTAELDGVHLHVLDVPSVRTRDALYGGLDEVPRFIAFSRGAAARVAAIVPDVFVAHDWHAALAICLLRTLHDMGPRRGIGVVQVLHNAAHTGICGESERWATGLPPELFQPDGVEFHGMLSLLKGGVVWADRIVAVSPRYAEEITTPAFGEGLDGLYRYRAHRLVGVANGIDTVRYDPSADPAIATPFGTRRPQGREECRVALLQEVGLELAPEGLLLGAIGRLVPQKGWDVLLEALPALVERGARLVLVGDGDASLAGQLAAAARHHPRSIVFRRGWDDAFARRVYAGTDAILVPSRFEPCGLVQLMAQRYGALPVAHAVGGLCDTIADEETGILFEPLSVDALVEAVERADRLIAERGRRAVAKALMRLDVSWRGPAKRWERILRRVADEAAARL
jgi:starch synthase